MNLGAGVSEADETVVALVVHDDYIQIFLVNIIAQDQVTPLLYCCLGLCHCQPNLIHALFCPLEYCFETFANMVVFLIEEISSSPSWGLPRRRIVENV